MELSSETPGESGVVGRLARRTRSGNRVWPDTIKGRAVFESMKPGARVCDVAQRYGIRAQQLTTWRGQARKGQIALVADEAAGFCDDRSERPSCRQEGYGACRHFDWQGYGSP